jgi:hypothetical protein
MVGVFCDGEDDSGQWPVGESVFVEALRTLGRGAVLTAAADAGIGLNAALGWVCKLPPLPPTAAAAGKPTPLLRLFRRLSGLPAAWWELPPR